VNPSVSLRSTYYSKRILLDRDGQPVVRTEDRDGDGYPDRYEDVGLDGLPGTGTWERVTGSWTSRTTNLNGILDSGEDLNGNGKLDTEDPDRDERLDLVSEDTEWMA